MQQQTDPPAQPMISPSAARAASNDLTMLSTDLHDKSIRDKN